MNILDLEKKFSIKYIELSNSLKKLSDEILKYGEVDLKNNDVSKAILIRLKYYYDSQQILKDILNKKYASPAADFFVETVAFYLKVIFQVYNLPLEVHSERNIRKKRGSIRPDISIWLNDNLIAIFECKTQLGWNRDKWESDFKEREERLNREFPEAQAFLLVATSLNWGGFSQQDENLGRKYFCLSSEWPNKIDINKLDNYLLNPIDELILSFFIKKYKK